MRLKPKWLRDYQSMDRRQREHFNRKVNWLVKDVLFHPVIVTLWVTVLLIIIGGLSG